MTEADPDDIGPDGTVRLRCYLPMANSVWFSACCDGLAGFAVYFIGSIFVTSLPLKQAPKSLVGAAHGARRVAG